MVLFMQEFYKGQKLYYKSKHGIQICEIIGWDHNSVYLKLKHGTLCKGPKWRIGYSLFNTAQALVEAEDKKEVSRIFRNNTVLKSRVQQQADVKPKPKPKSKPIPKSKLSGKRGIERPPKKRGGDQYINGINSYGTYKNASADKIVNRDDVE